MNFRGKVNILSNAFYFSKDFPKMELMRFQRFISKFSNEKGPLTCLDYIFGMLGSKIFPLAGSTRVYFFGTVLCLLNFNANSEASINFLWQNRQALPLTSLYLQPILESLANLTSFLNCDYDELFSLPQISHFLNKFVKQFQRISINELIVNETTLEKNQFLGVMFLLKTDFCIEQFFSLVNIIKSAKRDKFLFFHLLCNQFLFYLFTSDEPSYEFVNSMKEWDDKKQSGCLLSHLLYQFLLDNLEKLLEFSNVVPYFEMHFVSFKKSLEKDQLDLPSFDVPDVEIDIFL